MRKLLAFALLLSTPVFATAQAPSAKSNWARVQNIKLGTSIHIKTHDRGSIRCSVAAVDADSITCGGVTFQRSNILYIKNSRHTRSTLVGVGVGVGSAVAVTTAYGEACKSNCKVGTVAGIAIFDLGIVVAAPIVFGVFDLTAGTIYKAPTP